LSPRWLEVVGDFNVRGNIHTVITTRHARDGYIPPPPPSREGHR
jgi:NADPH-dependent 7-cyano-7-deazaguanine reductase QueF